MVGCHHWFNGHELEQTPGDSEEQESLMDFSPWVQKESDMTLQLNNNKQQKNPQTINARDDVERREPSYTAVGNVNCEFRIVVPQPLWKTVWRFLKKLNIELPYHPEISLLGIYSEKEIIQKYTCTSVFTAALFTIAKTCNDYTVEVRNRFKGLIW